MCLDSSVAERLLGKKEVVGSIPTPGSACGGRGKNEAGGLPPHRRLRDWILDCRIDGRTYIDIWPRLKRKKLMLVGGGLRVEWRECWCLAGWVWG